MQKLFVLLSLILCFSGALSAKLLTHFEFEDSLEDSVGDNDGVLRGLALLTYQTGRNGKALLFDGVNGYLEFGKGNFDPRYEGSYSISMWVLSTAQASSTNNNAYIGKHLSLGNTVILFGYFNGQLSSWSSNDTPIGGRDARFLTLEKCNCSDTSCTGTYMKADRFYNVLTGPKAQKTGLTNYNYYGRNLDFNRT